MGDSYFKIVRELFMAMEQSASFLNDAACEFGKVLNLTAPANAAEYVVALTEQLGIIIGMVAVLALGLPGNFAFLFVIYKIPHMQTITNFFLANLAIADILFLVVTVFMYVIFLGASQVRSDYNVASIFSCVGVFLVPHITYFTSICCVTVVSLERFYAICKPIRHRAINTKARAKRLLLACWVVAAVLTAIAMPKYSKLDMSCIVWPGEEKYQDLPQMLGFCRPVVPWWLVVGEFTTVSPFLIALPCNVFMYIRIVKTLSSRSIFKAEGQQRLPSQALQVRNQVAKMLIINGTVFFLCQAANQFVTVAYMTSFVTGMPISDTYDRLATVIDIGRIAVFVNSAVNPLIYNATSPHYRTAFRQAFGFSSKRSKITQDAPMPNKPVIDTHIPASAGNGTSQPSPCENCPPDVCKSTRERQASHIGNGSSVSRAHQEIIIDIGIDNEGFQECQAEIEEHTMINSTNDDPNNIHNNTGSYEEFDPEKESDSSAQELGTIKGAEVIKANDNCNGTLG